MKLSDFDFEFPRELIAKYPLEKRDESRLLIVDRRKKSFLEKKFFNLSNYLSKGDVLILNDTKVRRFRIFGKKITGGVVEVLIVENITPGVYGALISPSRGIKPGSEITFQKNLKCKVINNIGSVKKIEFELSDELEDIIESIGVVPLPPYIKRLAEKSDMERYQTVYAKKGGASAAPTAGLHFTKELLKKIEDLGVRIGFVTLDVSFGTFSPVKEEDFAKHKMHKERIFLPQKTADLINNAKARGKKVIAVGTTSLRVIEACSSRKGKVEPREGETDLFIYPPYEFKIADMLLTNFHFPKSTLLLLVSAFAEYDLIMKSYKYAIDKGFRLFSYGDAMLII